MSLPKSLRLKSKTAINNLFVDRKQINGKVLKFVYKILPKKETDSPFLFTVAVPKKLIKIAVKRNLIKRRIRASFMVNLKILEHRIPEGMQLQIMAIYMNNEVLDYKTINKNVISILNKIK